MIIRALIFILIVFLASACQKKESESFLFSYFTGNGEDGLHLASSEDGIHWEEISPGESFLHPEAGKDKLMRDPCIIRGGDGLFHMVWTVSWNEKGIGYASSPDLLHWSEQQYIPVMEHKKLARNCWAPEIVYEKNTEQYMIYWSTTIPGLFPETDPFGDDRYNHRIYYTLTKDFLEFTETEILYDHGFNVIDASIHKSGDYYLMFLKDETRWPEPQKNIHMATAPALTGPWSPPSGSITGNWVEGPTAISVSDGWMLYYDLYREHRMGAMFSTDLEIWTDISDSIRFPGNINHGSVLRISQEELNKLASYQR